MDLVPQAPTHGAVTARLEGILAESGDRDLEALAGSIREEGLEPHRDMLCTRLMEVFRATGSNEACSLLFELNTRPFLAAISSRLRRHYYLLDAQDVLQEVFFNIYRYPYRFKAEKAHSFRNWAHTIIRNTILKLIRDRARDARVQHFDEDIEARVDPRQRSPLSEVIREESEQECTRAYVLYLALYADHFNRLSEKERKALRMVEVDGKSYREVSEALSIKLENLKMVIFRARNKIYRNMERSLNALSSPPLS